MQYIIVGTIVIIISIITVVVNNNRIRKKRMNKIRESYGKKPEQKKFDFEYLGLHWNTYSTEIAEDEKIDDVTWSDLDMNQIFARVNVCSSFVGEQVLFSKLHCLPKVSRSVKLFRSSPKIDARK